MITGFDQRQQTAYSSSVNTEMTDDNHYSNTQNKINDQNMVEVVFNELSDNLLKLEHERGFFVIVSEFIDQYQEENFDNSFTEDNATMAKQLLQAFTGQFTLLI